VLFSFSCTDAFLSDFVQDPPESVAGVDGPTSVSSWRVLARSIETSWRSWALPLPQHPLCTRMASPGEVLGGEILPSHGDFPS
jgi:hypothetical protein